jgi:ABC-2 type transport system permease protein
MTEIITLLKPRFWSFKNGHSHADTKNRELKAVLFGLVGLAFWAGIFITFYRVLIYFQGAEGFGDILARKLLSMVLVTLFALLIFSSIITSLTKLYLSKDLVLVHSMPVSRGKVFLARWIESTVDSSWMVLVYSLPVFLSYGIVYNGGFFFYATAGMTILPLCMIASAISALAVVLIATILPAGRLRTVFVFLGIALFLLLIVAFRMMRPEQLVNPETFASLVAYLQSLETPGSPLLPTTWVFDSILASLTGAGVKSAIFDMALTWSFAVMLIFVVTWVSGGVYFRGYSRAQTTAERLFPARNQTEGGWLGATLQWSPFALSGPARAFIMKEIRTFFRDQTQWPQVFLIFALIVVYLYNFSVLPLERSPVKLVYLQNILSFLNMALAAFVLTAVAARFVYPAVSIEGDAFWIVKSSPIRIRTFLWIKFFVYYIPLLLLAEILIVISNILLHVTPFMMWLSVATVFCMVPGIVAMGVGLGAAYPDFKSENPAQSVTSFGGLLFMILCAGFIGLIIILEAGPVYSVFMAGIRDARLTFYQWVWLIGSFALVLLLCVLAVVLPMRLGEQRLKA